MHIIHVAPTCWPYSGCHPPSAGCWKSPATCTQMLMYVIHPGVYILQGLYHSLIGLCGWHGCCASRAWSQKQLLHMKPQLKPAVMRPNYPIQAGPLAPKVWGPPWRFKRPWRKCLRHYLCAISPLSVGRFRRAAFMREHGGRYIMYRSCDIDLILWYDLMHVVVKCFIMQSWSLDPAKSNMRDMQLHDHHLILTWKFTCYMDV